ncbi:MAG: hypothetical protein AAF411_01820, partial [Myxococcota bacterium]
GVVGLWGGDAAPWGGGAASLRLGGENSIANTRFAGMVVVDSQNVDVQSLTVSNVASANRNVGSDDIFATLELGDGMHLVGDLQGAVFERVSVQGAERVGLLLELGETPAPIFRNVQIEAPSGALGAVAGRATAMPFELDVRPESDWDEGITRDAASAVSDSEFAGILGVARAASPAPLPM